jgi:hypothetical protein
MKFLTIGTFKDTLYMLPRAEYLKLMVPGVQWVVDLKKKMGTKYSFYMTVEGKRSISIGEYSSFEEYFQSLQSPVAEAGHMNYESYPLIEYDEKSLKAAVAAVKAAIKATK